MKTLTLQYLNEHRTERGSWTFAQMKAIGVEWPQLRGWMKRIDGSEISDEQAAQFEAGKNVLAKKTLKNHRQQERELLIAMGKELPPRATAASPEEAEGDPSRGPEEGKARAEAG